MVVLKVVVCVCSRYSRARRLFQGGDLETLRSFSLGSERIDEIQKAFAPRHHIASGSRDSGAQSWPDVDVSAPIVLQVENCLTNFFVRLLYVPGVSALVLVR